LNLQHCIFKIKKRFKLDSSCERCKFKREIKIETHCDTQKITKINLKKKEKKIALIIRESHETHLAQTNWH
jgi:hypothetical protein